MRYGYRRIHVLLRREGWPVNVKRVCRLYREQGLQLRNKSPKRRVKAKLREDRSPATAANQVWAMDFVHDQLFDGRKFRVLTMVDTFTRLSPAIEVRQSFRGADVVQTLERVARELGYPQTIRLDNGPEFISRELDLWAFMHGVILDFSRPGKPTTPQRHRQQSADHASSGAGQTRPARRPMKREFPSPGGPRLGASSNDERTLLISG